MKIWKRSTAESVALAVMVAAALAIEGCTTVVEAPQKPPRPKIDSDKAVAIVVTCDHLGFARGGETHRLCVLRGIDRYVDHQTVPLSERYARVPECAQWPCR